MKNLRNYLRDLSPLPKFLIRVLYPVIFYLTAHFIFVVGLKLSTQTVQVVFILIWAFIEWQLFFRRVE
ncbi:MAG: hypothetical protein ACQERC_07655 [Bacteroidota bacterium]